MSQLKSITERINSAFDSLESDESKSNYIQAVRASLEDIETKLQANLKIVLVGMVAFELVVRASLSELSLGPIKITDLSMVQKILPAVVAYFYNQIISLYAIRILARQVHDRAIKYTARSIYENDLEYFTLPHSWFLTEDIMKQYTGIKLFTIITIPVKFATVVAPIAFLVYAYYQNFRISGSSDILVWSSLIASVILAIQGAMFYFYSPHDRRGASAAPEGASK